MSTILLLHGEDASILDSSTLNTKTITPFNSAVTSATSSKFGAKSIYTPQAGYFEVNYDTDFDFGSQDFCIEWFSATTGFDGNGRACIMEIASNVSHSAFSVRVIHRNNGNVYFYVKEAGGTESPQLMGSTFMTAGGPTDYHHLALVREGTTIRMYIDGVASPGSYTIGTNSLYFDSNHRFRMGSMIASVNRFTGYIDDVRVVTGSPVYTANFTPPTSSLEEFVSTIIKHLVKDMNDGNIYNIVAAALNQIGNGALTESMFTTSGMDDLTELTQTLINQMTTPRLYTYKKE